MHDRRDGYRETVAEMMPDALSRHELDDLYELAVVTALESGVAVLGGASLQTEDVVPVVYKRLTSDLVANGCRVVVDLAGARLNAALSPETPVRGAWARRETLQRTLRASDTGLSCDSC